LVSGLVGWIVDEQLLHHLGCLGVVARMLLEAGELAQEKVMVVAEPPSFGFDPILVDVVRQQVACVETVTRTVILKVSRRPRPARGL
jgi:hypothetical protein